MSWRDMVYHHPVRPIAEAALRRGGFVKSSATGKGNCVWLHGRRRFSQNTINRLINDGLAVKQGNRVVATEHQRESA